MDSTQGVWSTGSIGPLDIVAMQGQTKHQLILDSVEKQVCDYISSAAKSGNTININFLKEIFSNARVGYSWTSRLKQSIDLEK